jgi:hypothetical protein
MWTLILRIRALMIHHSPTALLIGSRHHLAWQCKWWNAQYQNRTLYWVTEASAKPEKHSAKSDTRQRKLGELYIGNDHFVEYFLSGRICRVSLGTRQRKALVAISGTSSIYIHAAMHAHTHKCSDHALYFYMATYISWVHGVQRQPCHAMPCMHTQRQGVA